MTKRHDPATAFEALARKFSQLTSDSWQLSPERTLLAVVLCAEALAVQFIRRHPDQREHMLARLAQLVANVEMATEVRGDEVRH